MFTNIFAYIQNIQVIRLVRCGVWNLTKPCITCSCFVYIQENVHHMKINVYIHTCMSVVRYASTTAHIDRDPNIGKNMKYSNTYLCYCVLMHHYRWFLKYTVTVIFNIISLRHTHTDTHTHIQMLLSSYMMYIRACAT